ncbi:hypothetical protein HW450_04160 [Corynebacterium hindlerae]|uniref:Uncharacterized protein n=2 Tax=Corynebacterium hindlerae TaxID=699041 RepID=A0A7G5FH30_9CORY|nr:hypothetical protein HW450_04160 [Corynebacterium hindlerae]
MWSVINAEPRVPTPVKYAGYLAMIQSLIGLGYAGILIYRELIGERDAAIVTDTEARAGLIGYGTAIYFIIIFGAVLAGAISMNKGRRWGRGPVAMLEMFLLVVAYYMWSAGQPAWAGVVAVSGVLGLFLLFNSKSLAWATANHR